MEHANRACRGVREHAPHRARSARDRGAVRPTIDGAELTLMQRAVPDALLARVFGAFDDPCSSPVLGSLSGTTPHQRCDSRSTLIAVGALLPALTSARLPAAVAARPQHHRGRRVSSLLRSNPILQLAGRGDARNARRAASAGEAKSARRPWRPLLLMSKMGASLLVSPTRSLEHSEPARSALLRDVPRTRSRIPAPPRRF